MSTVSSFSRGIGTLGLLGICFVVLKLCHVIDWSWWFVTMPFWGMLGVALVVCAIVGIAAVISVVFETARTRKAARRYRL